MIEPAPIIHSSLSRMMKASAKKPTIKETVASQAPVRSQTAEPHAESDPQSQRQKTQSKPGFDHCDEPADSGGRARGTANRVRRRATRCIPRR